MTPQQQATQWINQNALILDTETTGLNSKAEIVELSIIACSGEVVIDTLVRPIKPIPREAIDIHGITDEMVAKAPLWSEIFPTFCNHVSRRPLVIYNASYDIRIIKQTSCRYGLMTPWLKNLEADCAMRAYAEFFGDWNANQGKYRWQKLTLAAEQQGVKSDGQAHRALADCRLTLGIIKAMAAP